MQLGSCGEESNIISEHQALGVNCTSRNKSRGNISLLGTGMRFFLVSCVPIQGSCVALLSSFFATSFMVLHTIGSCWNAYTCVFWTWCKWRPLLQDSCKRMICSSIIALVNVENEWNRLRRPKQVRFCTALFKKNTEK